jgi:hypothetical protein
MAFDSNMGWEPAKPENQRFLIIDSSVWSRAGSIERLPSSVPIAITVATLVEIMTPPDSEEFDRRRRCADLIHRHASILLPNASRYRRVLFGTETFEDLRADTARFAEALEAFRACPSYEAWLNGNGGFFGWLRVERDRGYLEFARELKESREGVYRSGFELARQNGIEVSREDREDRQIILRLLDQMLRTQNWQPYLLPELLPQYNNAAYYYLRLFTLLIATNLPSRATSSGLDVEGNDMGDMEDAYFFGSIPNEIGGGFGIGLITERKWRGLTRENDRKGLHFPMGTPSWIEGIDIATAAFDFPGATQAQLEGNQ